MAVWSYHPEYGRNLTSFGQDAKAGDVVETSIGSRAYSLPRTGFGWRSCQFTRYTLPEPVGADQWGNPLFDVEGLGVCPLDDSPQTPEAERAGTAGRIDRRD